MYDGGDLGAICEGVRPRAKRVKRDGSRMELFSFFVDECAKNLRIALVCILSLVIFNPYIRMTNTHTHMYNTYIRTYIHRHI